MTTFEDRLRALETIVERLEQGDLTLDESVSMFEEGVRLSDSCKRELEMAEGRIQVLMQKHGNEMQMADLEIEEEDFNEDSVGPQSDTTRAGL